MNKNPTYHRPINLDCVVSERLASATVEFVAWSWKLLFL